jgi:hypothetical protein
MRLQTKLNVLHFVRQHPGTRRKAVLGWRYDFNAPEWTRAPFRVTTLEALISEGLIATTGDRVTLSALGLILLRQYRSTACEGLK